MRKYLFIAPHLALTLFAIGNAWVSNTSAQETVGDIVDFSDVRTVLRERCMTCHNVDEARGDLDLSSIASIQSGSGSGPVIVPGKPNESLLYTVSAHLEEPVMPPNSPKIPGRELDLIKRWIEGMSDDTGESRESAVSTSASKMVASSETSGKSAMDDGATQAGLARVKPLLQATGIRALVVHPSESIFVTSGHGQAVIGSYETGQWLGAIDFPFGEVTALKFSTDGKTLLIAGGVAGLSGTVIGVDWESGSRKFQVADEVDSILAMDISENGRLLAVGGPKKVVRIYSIDSNEVVHSLKKHTDWILSLAFSPDGLLLASGDRFGGVFVWNPDTGEVFQALQGHQGPVSAIAWDNSSENLLTGCEDGKLRVWNMHHGEMTTAWDAKVGPILSIDHAANNATLVGGRGNHASVWFGPEVHNILGQHKDHVVQVGLAAGGTMAVLGDALGNISIVSVESGDQQHSMSLPVNEGQVQQLLARLEAMEVEFLSRSDSEIAEVTEDAQATFDGVSTDTGKVAIDPFTENEFIQSLLTTAELTQRTLQVGLQSQKDLLAELSAVRQETEDTLARVLAAERVAYQSLKTQAELVEETKRLVDQLHAKYNSKVDRKELAARLKAESELVVETEKVLELLDNQPNMKSSEELQLLKKVHESLLHRKQATAQTIDSSTP